MIVKLYAMVEHAMDVVVGDLCDQLIDDLWDQCEIEINVPSVRSSVPSVPSARSMNKEKNAV